jgi:hypothetical protein
VSFILGMPGIFNQLIFFGGIFRTNKNAISGNLLKESD